MLNFQKHKNLFRKIFIFIFLFISNLIDGEGFISGTLIKTKCGYTEIEKLKESDKVLSYNYKLKQIIESKILKIQKNHSDKAIKLLINNKEIITTPDHKFFCPLRKGNWIKAKDLTPCDFILKNVFSLIRIEKIESFDCDNDFYCLSIDQNHNFFVSEEGIFVHNIEPLTCTIVLGSIAEFEVLLEVGIPAVVGAAAYISHHLFGKKNDSNFSKINTNPDGNQNSNFNPDPNDPKWKRILNQINQKIKKGQAPNGLKRVDYDHVKNPDPNKAHAHFSDNSALNIDGTYRHADPSPWLTNSVKQFLRSYGWKI